MQINRKLIENFLNLFGCSLSPRDRILSAISRDGIVWHRENGVRHDAGGLHNNNMVYYCHAIPLEAGGYRMYYHGSIMTKDGWRGRILSAVSQDGLKWKDEPCIIVNYGEKYDTLHARSPSLCKLQNGCFRLYYSGVDSQKVGRILSATSIDGLTWNKEEGARLEPADFDCNSLMDCNIVSLENGLLRMYVSIVTNSTENIRSAVCVNGLRWKVEPGIRIDCGQPGRMNVANNPCVLAMPEGWRMYFRGGDKVAIENNIYWAESSDGLDWCVKGIALEHDKRYRYERNGVAFPFVMKLSNGLWRMYYTGYWGRHWKEHRLVSHWESETEKILAKMD